MKCRYCSVVLAPLRSLTDGEFCCDSHREMFRQQGEAAPSASPVPRSDSLVHLHVAISGADTGIPAAGRNDSAPEDFHTEVSRAFHFHAQPPDELTGLPVADRLLPLKVTQTVAESREVNPISVPTEVVFPGRTM